MYVFIMTQSLLTTGRLATRLIFKRVMYSTSSIISAINILHVTKSHVSLPIQFSALQETEFCKQRCTSLYSKIFNSTGAEGADGNGWEGLNQEFSTRITWS